MPSRHGGGGEGNDAGEPHDNEQGNVQFDKDHHHQQEESIPMPVATVLAALEAPAPLDESTVSVLVDEEDSYRVVAEHDEHLARIRAYTDFFDTLGLLMRNTKANEASATQAHQNIQQSDVGAPAGGVNSPSPQPPLAERTPTDNGDFALRSESGQHTPFTSMDRELILASATPQSAYAGSWDYHAPAVVDAHAVSRLEEEKRQLTQELLESHARIQQLQASLQEARKPEAAEERAEVDIERQHTSRPDAAPTQDSTRPPLRPRLASPSSLSSLTNSISRGQSNTPPSEPFVDLAASTEIGASHQHEQQQQQQLEDVASTERRHTQQFLSQDQQLRQAKHFRGPSSSSSPNRGGAAPPPTSTIDVSEFFWTLRVAPPPSDLHESCGYKDHCHASLVATGDAASGNGNHRSYGTTAAREEAVALACESAWVESSFYCYNIMEEMSCLRVVRSWDDVAEEATMGNKPLAQMTEEEVTRVLLDRTPAMSPLPPSLHRLPSPIAVNAQNPAAAWPTSAAVLSSSSLSEGGVFGTGGGFLVGPHPSAAAASERYRLPYLQRLWLTSVVRQYLLFLLLTITCVLLLIPGVMIGTVNVFEAADGDDFYATRNRFGRSALLTVARLGSACVVFLAFFGFVCAEGGRRQTTATPTRATSSDQLSNRGSPLRAASPAPRVTRSAPLGTVVHGVLCLGAVLLFVGSVLFNRGCVARNLPLALLGMGLYGAGEALVLGGVGTIVSAEVGVAAGVNVSLQLLLSNWLLVNAFGAFVLPKLSYYIYSPSQLIASQMYTTATIGAFVFALVMLCPRDLIERAVHTHAKFVSPRKLLSAARHDVSLCFYLRAVTVGLLTAAVALLLLAGPAVFVPSQAEAASVSESAKSKELMGTGTGKRNTANTASDAGFIAANMDRWLSQQRHASAFLFAFALLFVPLCFIPRLAAVINRWCPVALMTTLLCLLWSSSTASSWATVLGFSASDADSDSSDKMERLRNAEMWIGEHPFLAFSPLLCGAATGIIYTIVVSSLLRSIANAGVQLPVLHPRRWHMAFTGRDREGLHQHSKDSLPSSSPTESSPLISGTKEAEVNAAGAATAPLSAVETEARYLDERMRCVRMQLRGGPAVMTVLVALLVMIVLIACVTVTMVAAALLTDRSENPVYVNAVMPGVTWDEHLLVKTVVAFVFALAMLVQWVELFERVCCCCCY